MAKISPPVSTGTTMAKDGAQPIRSLKEGAQPTKAQANTGPGKPPNQGSGGKK